MERKHKACTHCALTHHAIIPGAQKVERKRKKAKRAREKRKLFHTCMQSKIKIPNKLQDNEKKNNSKTNREGSKISNPKYMEGEGNWKERKGE